MPNLKPKSNKQKQPPQKPTTILSSKESLTNEITPKLSAGQGLESIPSTQENGKSELAALEQQLHASKPGRKETQTDAPGVNASSPLDSPGGKPSRRKFRVKPENTFRMVLKQYWRLRDFMARRSLGLPSEYAGIFIQGKDDKLVEPLVEPLIGVIESYAPDVIVFIEEKSPLLQVFMALAEVEHTFGAGVALVGAELKKNAPQAGGDSKDAPRTVFPSVNETVGKAAKVSA